MEGKGLRTTVQEYKGKFTTPIPMALVNLLVIEKGDKLNWTIKGDQIRVDIIAMRVSHKS